MGGAARTGRQQAVQAPQRPQVGGEHQAPAEPAEAGRRMIGAVRQVQQDDRRRWHQQQAEQRQGAPAQAPGQPAPQPRAERGQGKQRGALPRGVDEAQHLAGQGQRPPAGAPGQQQLGQTLQAQAAQRPGLLAQQHVAQAPGTDLGGQRQHQRRPEAGMGQRPQPLARQLAEQQRAGGQEGDAADHLQQQAEQEAGAQLQAQAEPDDQQTAAGPDRRRAAPGQHEQHGQVDEQQAYQHDQRQAAHQPHVLAHQPVAHGDQHAGHQRQADQRTHQQAAPAGMQRAGITQAAALHLNEEHAPAQ